MSLKLIEQKRYQKSGRLVPRWSTDDGVLLRKAMLSEDCIKDLVRPLRDAGWDVEVEEPTSKPSTSGSSQKRMGSALVQRCCSAAQRTTVSIARSAETSEAIRYLVWSYQQQYAYGINAHVGTGRCSPPAGRAAATTPKLETTWTSESAFGTWRKALKDRPETACKAWIGSKNYESALN